MTAIEIELGGKKRPVAFTVNALIEFEGLIGSDFNGLGAEIMKLKNLRALTFVGLKHGAKAEGQAVDFTLEDVGDWLNLTNGSTTAIIDAFMNHSTPVTDNHASAEVEDVKK